MGLDFQKKKANHRGATATLAMGGAGGVLAPHMVPTSRPGTRLCSVSARPNSPMVWTFDRSNINYLGRDPAYAAVHNVSYPEKANSHSSPAWTPGLSLHRQSFVLSQRLDLY